MSLHRFGETQTLQFPPQLFMLLIAKQEPLQMLLPAGQKQAPLHAKPGAQTWPHVPQLLVSVDVLLHTPEQQFSAHAAAPPHVQLLPVHPSELTDEHAFEHVTGVPQLFVVVPHDRPLHALFGTQQWLGPAPPTPHGVPTPHVFGHVMACPQLFVVGPHALLLHGVWLSVTQQEFGPAPPTPHGVAAPHVFGHVIAVPQLFVAGPHALPLHGVVLSAVQPHAFAPAPPPPHVFGDWQVSGQVMAWPQLFVAGPQTLPVHAAVLAGVQHVLSDWQTPALGQVAGQATV